MPNCRWDTSVRLLPPSVNTSHWVQIAQQDPGGWKNPPSPLLTPCIRSLSRASWQAVLLVEPLTASVRRGKQRGGVGTPSWHLERRAAKGKHLPCETRATWTWWSRYAPLFPNRPQKTSALTLSNLIFSPKTKWMTSIQLAALLVPFQLLESLKSRRHFHKHFPRRWRSTLVLISRSNTATQPCFYLCEGGSIAPSN